MVWSSANSKFQGILVKQFFSCLINIQISIQWQNSLLALFWNQDQIVIINLTKLLFFQIECSIPKKKKKGMFRLWVNDRLTVPKTSLFYAQLFLRLFFNFFSSFKWVFFPDTNKLIKNILTFLFLNLYILYQDQIQNFLSRSQSQKIIRTYGRTVDALFSTTPNQ